MNEETAKAAAAIKADPAQVGEAAYEAHRALIPNYHDGTPRPAWAKLSEWAKWSWNKNDTFR